MTTCRLEIIRAVNYSIMHLEELRKEAIEKRVTIGEIYYEKLKKKKMKKEEIRAIKMVLGVYLFYAALVLMFILPLYIFVGCL